MKTLKYTNGNLLLNKDVQAIGHQANCQNVFGAGIARSIREMYPDAYVVDTLCSVKKQNILGNFSMAHIPKEQREKHGTNIHRIFNLYGQNIGAKFEKQDGRMTNYDALYNALVGMEEVLSSFDGNHPPSVVGFPYMMGCGLARGSWDIVERLIEVAFDGYESDVIIVKFSP